MRPTLFEEDQWTMTAIYYRYGVSLDKLDSLAKWKRAYQDELKRLEEAERPSVPEEE